MRSPSIELSDSDILCKDSEDNVWIGSKQAAHLLGMNSVHSRAFKGLPVRLFRLGAGRPSRLYRLADIERAASLHRDTGIPKRNAIKVVAAEAVGRL